MVGHFSGLSPGVPGDAQQRLQWVIAFWNGLSCCEDAGETTWGVLEDLQAQVSNCLRGDSVDLECAESLTAKAAMLISGQIIA
jgi:hypothetical protein